VRRNNLSELQAGPFIVGSETDSIDMMAVVSEAVSFYCGLKVKLDADRHLGP
jgi:hypothetical protein